MGIGVRGLGFEVWVSEYCLCGLRRGSTSCGACEVRCWRWLFGKKIPDSLSVRFAVVQRALFLHQYQHCRDVRTHTSALKLEPPSALKLESAVNGTPRSNRPYEALGQLGQDEPASG